MTTVQIVSFFLSIQLAVLAYVVSLYFGLIKSGELVEDKRINDTTLFVGIVSSPDHFKERQSLRDTWLQINPGSFHYRFLIGQLCDIHPQDRTSQYNCKHLHITIPKYSKSNHLLNATSIGSSKPGQIINRLWFNFYVHHSIVVHYLGVKTNLNLNQNATWARVVLLNSTSSYKVSSVTFEKGSLHWDLNNLGYTYKKLKDPVVLPRGFEGSLRLEGLFEIDQTSPICIKTTIWTHSNLITIHQPDPNINSCFLSTFSFTIKDLKSLQFYLNNNSLRKTEWLQHNQELANNLQQEADKFKDIQFLNVVDVYRNLPQKVLHLIKWVHENYNNVDYVLKTDDDTFIDTSAVLRELVSSNGWNLWSCFRVGWPVQRFGRHRESAYSKEIYPPFPSGAGYVLSKSALNWLISRMNELSTLYQGEDVAMGIWLEKFDMQQHVGKACYWACNNHCHTNTCNAMQLSVEDVYTMWEHYKSCGNKICKCPDR